MSTTRSPRVVSRQEWRGEDGPYRTLADWVRPRAMYGQGGMVEVIGCDHQPACACAVHESGAG